MDPLVTIPTDEDTFEAKSPSTPVKTNIGRDDYWPLSGKPYFDMVLARTHVRPMCQLGIPQKFQKFLPNLMVPVTLTGNGKDWEMSYIGTNKSYKRFDPCWKKFVIDNDLKAGDACVFELAECSNTRIKFKVQILRGDIPAELMRKINGGVEDSPIIIE